VGGICGHVNCASPTGNVEFQNCYNTGKVESTNDVEDEGGIVGFGGSNLIVANCYSSKESSSHNFGEMQGIEKNNKQYSSDYMKSVQFLNQLNSNRGSNSDWFRWKIRSNSAFPLPVNTINKANTTFSGKKKISKIYTDKVFALNVKLSSGNGKLTYKSSDKKVATVSKNGKVSVKGIGKARITITAAETKNYKSAKYEVTITVKPKKQKVTLKIKKNKIVATWKKDSKASGYQIQCAANKKFTKNCKTIDVTQNTTTKDTFEKIKKKTKYYVRVRSYKKVKKNGKTSIIYGSWSRIKVISSKK
jgi:hypothetical protein